MKQKVMLGAVTLLLSASVFASPAGLVFPSQELEEAKPYAREFGISARDAALRLRLQSEAADAITALRREFAPRLAGLYYEHSPDYGLVLRLTGLQAVPKRALHLSSGNLKVSFTLGAPATYKELEADIERFEPKLLQMIPEIQSLHVDAKTGEIVIRILAEPAAHAAYLREKANLQKVLRRSVRIDFVSNPMRPLGYVRGGGNLSLNGFLCTAGLVVSDGSGGRGLATAAHCGDQRGFYYSNHPTSSAGYVQSNILGAPPARRYATATQDFQVHSLAPDSPHTIGLGFYGLHPTNGVHITARRTRAQTVDGEVVCHRGSQTGYSCGTVTTTSIRVKPCFGAPVCERTWILVQGPDLKCHGGDSGGPAFRSTWVFGIVTNGGGDLDGNCVDGMVYMSVDYMYEAGYLIF